MERGAHPHFAVGESSTPLANLVLESLAQTYDLPRLAPLAEYGPWQRSYPHLACGVKRGFTFFQHEEGRPFQRAATAPTNCWSAPIRPTTRPTLTGSASTSIIFFSQRRSAGSVIHRPHGDNGDIWWAWKLVARRPP